MLHGQKPKHHSYYLNYSFCTLIFFTCFKINKILLIIFIFMIIYLAVSGLSCGTWDFCCAAWVSSVVVHRLFIVVESRLSCSVVCEILVP